MRNIVSPSKPKGLPVAPGEGNLLHTIEQEVRSFINKTRTNFGVALTTVALGGCAAELPKSSHQTAPAQKNEISVSTPSIPSIQVTPPIEVPEQWATQKGNTVLKNNQKKLPQPTPEKPWIDIKNVPKKTVHKKIDNSSVIDPWKTSSQNPLPPQTMPPPQIPSCPTSVLPFPAGAEDGWEPLNPDKK